MLSWPGFAAGVVLSFLGAWSAGTYSRKSGQPDDGRIVIDEVLGAWIACSASTSAWGLAGAFLAFRFFDIVKPPPIRWVDRWSKKQRDDTRRGWGILLDDLLAGGIVLVMSLGLQALLPNLLKEARAVHEGLRSHGIKIVLAESCTGGLVSALLCSQPGISDVHCGSSVVYREETKANWLGVSRAMLQSETAVSTAVTQTMALNNLRHTPEANMSVAITGYLAGTSKIPKGQMGLVIGSIAVRGQPVRTERWHIKNHPVFQHRDRGEKKTISSSKRAPKAQDLSKLRWSHQCVASLYVLQMVRSLLSPA